MKAIERFWEKVDKTADCWVWLGARSKSRSAEYGSFRGIRAHRIAYELVVGPIPEGLVIDHLCRNTLCVRPEHLEAVTQRENVLRGDAPPAHNATKTHCSKGHPYDEANTFYRPSSGRARRCRACNRISVRNAMRKNREAKRSALNHQEGQ